MIEFIKENKIFSIFIGFMVLVIILLGVVAFTEGPIPNCKICGQPEWTVEFYGYIPIMTYIGDVPVWNLIPQYQNVPHACKGKQ